MFSTPGFPRPSGPTAHSAGRSGLVLGGALGNLTDRVMNGPGLTGRVTDFIDLRIWPVFNLADTSVVVGAVLLALASFRREEREAG